MWNDQLRTMRDAIQVCLERRQQLTESSAVNGQHADIWDCIYVVVKHHKQGHIVNEGDVGEVDVYLMMAGWIWYRERFVNRGDVCVHCDKFWVSSSAQKNSIYDL